MSTRTEDLGFLGPWRTLVRNFGLVRQLTKRDVIGRYRGSMFGVVWSFFNPLLLLVVYTFVFAHIFKSRWGLPNEGKSEFAIVLFVGMIIHTLFAECTNRAPSLVVSNPNYVKKIVFPLECLPWMVVGAAVFHAMVSTLALLLAQMVVLHALPITVIAFPLVLLVFLPAVVGTVWLLSATGVFVRDLHQAVGILTVALLFLAPVFYPSSIIREPYRNLLLLNPLTFVIEQSRDVLIWGRWPDWMGLVLYGLGSSLFAWVALRWFQRARTGFADVL